MVRLSINPLLYAGALAAFGYAGYLAATEVQKPLANPEQRRAAVKTRFERAIERGLASEPLTAVHDYSNPKWRAFTTVNLSGKPKPPPPADPDEGAGDEPPPPPPPEQIPLDEILTIVTIVYDGDGPEGTTSVWVRYVHPDIQPPENVVRALSAGSGMPRDTAGVQMPLAPGQVDKVLHALRVGDRLWKPFDHIELRRVSEYGDSAFFVRHEEGKEEGDLAEEEVFQNELDLSPEILQKLAEGRRKSVLERAAGAGRREREGGAAAAGSGEWLPGEVTREVRPNQFHIGSEDYREISRDPNRIFNEEVGFQAYRGSAGTRGLIVTRVSPRLARFGIRGGDVILSVNGQPVTSQAQAVQVGKRLYRRGVRTFRVEMLSSGRKVERTVTVPDQ